MLSTACSTEVSLAKLPPSIELYGVGTTLLGEMTFDTGIDPSCAVFDDSFRATANGASSISTGHT